MNFTTATTKLSALAFGAALSAGALAGCGDSTTTADTTSPDTTASQPAATTPDTPGTTVGADPNQGSQLNPVAGEWVLDFLTVEGDMAIEIPEDARPTLTIEGTSVSGFSGCNTYGGSTTYDIDADTFSVEDGLTMTEMACEDVDDLEQRFTAALTGAATWSLEDGRLSLSDAAEFPTTLTFSPAAMADDTTDTDVE
jgi:heat shock protein HslJ